MKTRRRDQNRKGNFLLGTERIIFNEMTRQGLGLGTVSWGKVTRDVLGQWGSSWKMRGIFVGVLYRSVSVLSPSLW